MTSSTLHQRIYTIQEYLDRETQAQERHEYRNGEIILMSGGTPNHNRINLNFAGALNFSLKRQPFDVFMTDQRLWIPDKTLYTYPDVMVIQQPLTLQPGRKDTVMNPLLIAEVLSNSTRSYDKDEKFAAYRSLSSFQEYVLIDQYSPHVEHYTKTDDKAWLFREYDGLETSIFLQSIDFQIDLTDIYEKVEF